MQLSKKINILDVYINILTQNQVLEKIDKFLSSNQQHQIVTVNPEFILEAQKDKEFRDIINKASLSVADGMGVRMAAKYLDIRSKNKLVAFFQGLKVGWWGVFDRERLNVVPEVIAGTDLMPEMCRVVEIRNKKLEIRESKEDSRTGYPVLESSLGNRIFLLGGYGDTPRLVAGKLKDDFGSLEFGYSIFEAEHIIDRINNFKPQVLLVALNHPMAQKWIDENLEKMPSVGVAMGVGGAFDYISGQVKRAPKFLRKIGLEWLYRLIKQPLKRTRRIYNAVVRFAWLVYISNS